MPKKPNNFTTRVQEIVKKIPPGQTLSYKEVATAAGNSGAARAVANLMAKNFDHEIPCHRVILSNGELGEYNRGGTKEKKRMLDREKITQKTAKRPMM